MSVKRTLFASSLAAGVGLAGLFGIGLGTANADPGQCGAPNAPMCQPGPQQGGPGGPQDGRPGGPQQGGPGDPGRDGPGGPGGPQQGPPPDVWQRGIDQGRQDHRPFVYGGQQVNPVFDDHHGGWGFWFFGMWIPL